MQKNVNSQPVSVFMRDSAGGGVAGILDLVISVLVDQGTRAAIVGASTDEGGGWYSALLTAAETNGDILSFDATGTGAITTAFTIITDQAVRPSVLNDDFQAELATGDVATETNVDATQALIAALNDFNAATDLVANVTNVVQVTGSVQGSVAGSVGSVVGNVGGNVAGSVASVTANVNAAVVSMATDVITAAALTDAAIAKMFGHAYEQTETVEEFFRLARAAVAGITNGTAGVGTNIVYHGQVGSAKPRIDMDVDVAGNRTLNSVDVTP